MSAHCRDVCSKAEEETAGEAVRDSSDARSSVTTGSFSTMVALVLYRSSLHRYRPVGSGRTSNSYLTTDDVSHACGGAAGSRGTGRGARETSTRGL